MTLDLTATQLTDPGDGLPLLVVGPSIGTSVTVLWSSCAARLAGRFHVVGWDLPGHGRSATTREPFTMADLAAAVVSLVDKIDPSTGSGHDPSAGSGRATREFFYAGDSAGGAVGLQLLLDAPDRIVAAVIISSGAKIGEAEGWTERADLVRVAGTPALVEGSVQRWFAPGFLERDPETATALLDSLQDADRFGYATACEALSTFDVRHRLGEITQPVLVATGESDEATPRALGEQIAAGVANGRFVVIDRAAHLPPAEQPAAVAELLTAFFLPEGEPTGRDMWEPAATLEEVYDAGMAVRREVLGDAHVDRATASADEFTADFQELITTYAWGSIWTRPGLDRRSRSLITLTALVARGRHEELAMHVRAALRNGLKPDEIKELLLQTAIYCGVPDANTAFRIAHDALNECRGEQDQHQKED
jgi:3-oxoadipate enol-lactonase / 4-carboxymuconolactone decarboxylase